MTVPGFIALTAALAASLAAASAAALVLYRKVRRMRGSQVKLARIVYALASKANIFGLNNRCPEFRDLAGWAGPRKELEAMEAAAALDERLSEAMSVYSEYRRGRTLPPCFVPRVLDPDGILRGLGRAEGPGCEAAGYAAWPYRSEWMEFRPANPRYAWFALPLSYGPGLIWASMGQMVATLFQSEMTREANTLYRPGTLPEILYRVNDYIESRGFEGMSVAACMGLWDRQEKEAVLCGAGVSRLSRWSAVTRSVEWVELPPSPPIGCFPNFLVEMKSPFKPTRLKLDPGDVLFLWNDIDDSLRHAREETGRIKLRNSTLPDGTVQEAPVFEYFGSDRIVSLLTAVGSRSTWRLEKEGGLPGEEDLVFDFSACEGRPEDFALALAAVERIFRMYPDPGAEPEDRVYLDPETDAFLVRHFPKVGLYRNEGMVRVLEGPDLGRAGGGVTNGEGKVVEWGRVREDRQYDVSILAIGRKD